MQDGPHLIAPIMDVSRETIERLRTFEDLLRRWQRKTNLVGTDTLDRFWQQHVGDAAFLYAHGREVAAWTDIGAGAGLPGLVIALLAAGDGHEVSVDLVESNGKKCAFQRAAVLETGLRGGSVAVQVHNCRIEAYRAREGSVLTARALAPLTDLIRHLRSLGLSRGLFLKGERHDEEIEGARAKHAFAVGVHPHPLRFGSALLEVRL